MNNEKAIAVTDSMFQRLITTNGSYSISVTSGIPNGAQFKGAYYDHLTASWHVRYEHPSFEPVNSGSHIPVDYGAITITDLPSQSKQDRQLLSDLCRLLGNEPHTGCYGTDRLLQLIRDKNEAEKKVKELTSLISSLHELTNKQRDELSDVRYQKERTRASEDRLRILVGDIARLLNSYADSLSSCSTVEAIYSGVGQVGI